MTRWGEDWRFWFHVVPPCHCVTALRSCDTRWMCLYSPLSRHTHTPWQVSTLLPSLAVKTVGNLSGLLPLVGVKQKDVDWGHFCDLFSNFYIYLFNMIWFITMNYFQVLFHRYHEPINYIHIDLCLVCSFGVFFLPLQHFSDHQLHHRQLFSCVITDVFHLCSAYKYTSLPLVSICSFCLLKLWLFCSDSLWFISVNFFLLFYFFIFCVFSLDLQRTDVDKSGTWTPRLFS